MIIAEPVGSCIPATASNQKDRIKMKQFLTRYSRQVTDAGSSRRSQCGFSPKAAYIFEKQLEELISLIVNRIDELSIDEVSELESLLMTKHPDIPVVKISAKTGEGMEQLVSMIDQQGEFGSRILELDYDIYAEGEAELGWLNSSLQVQADLPFDLDGLLLDIIERLRIALEAINAETAHLKTIGVGDAAHAAAN